METKKTTKLAIGGKVISIEKIEESSLEQWKAQLKNAGISVDATTAERLYLNLRGELTPEQRTTKEAAEEKAAAIKAAAEVKAAAIKAAADAKFNK